METSTPFANLRFTALLAVCVALCAAWSGCAPERRVDPQAAEPCEGPSVVRVRQTAGGPQLFADGKPVPPRLFWGRRGVRPCPVVSNRWTRQELTFTAPVDVDNASVHFRFQPIPNGGAQIRRVCVLTNGVSCGPDFANAFSDDAAFRKAWRVWPPRHGEAVTVSNGVCGVRMGNWAPQDRADFHLSSVRFPLKAGETLTLAFEARGVGDCRWVLPNVYRIASDGRHDSLVSGDDNTLLSTARKAAAAGVDFVSYSAPMPWRAEGIDFSEADALADALIAVNPNVRLVPRVSVNAPAWWLKAHPDHRMRLDGPQGECPEMASVSSRLYRQAAQDYIVRVCRHLMEKYPRHFAGIHPTGQNTEEWFYFRSWSRINGYDAQTRAAFRAFLGDSTAEAPSPSDRAAQDGANPLLDPATQARVLAFNRFQQLEMSDFVADLARACRQATDGRKLVVLFYGYAYEFAAHRLGPANAGHYGLANLLAKAEGAIDILCSPISYFDRAWCGSAPSMSASETVERHGILWLNEDDSRTFRDLRDEEVVGEGSKVNVAQSRQVTLRNTAAAAVRGFGSWWMDLQGVGWYDARELWDVQAALQPLERRVCRRARPYAPDTALVLDEASMLHVRPNAHGFTGPLLRDARRDVNRAGVSQGQYLLSDVLANPLAARLQIFPNAWCLSDAALEGLVRQRRAHPAWRVWCWAPGAFREDGTEDVSRMSRLLGFPMARLDAATCLVARPTARGIAEGLRADVDYGNPSLRAPAFTVTDVAAGDEVWARYPNGAPALVVRPSANGGGDVFLGLAQLPPELVHALARRAGAQTFLARADVGKASVWAATGALDDGRTGLGVVQAMADATVTLTLPARAELRDALSGACLGRDEAIPLALRRGEVRVFSFAAVKSDPNKEQPR